MNFYQKYSERVAQARVMLGRELVLAEKILYAHLHPQTPLRDYVRGEEYVDFSPDRVAMQDATAQMALLQFMNAGRAAVAVPSSVHCDHLIVAQKGVGEDLPAALSQNSEVYSFLQGVSSKYGIDFWGAGSGIIHQVVLENYALPGGLMVGTDSHTPNAGGMAMLAIGVGGADAVDVMANLPWELKMPRVIGVRLTGALGGWASAKDVILKLAGILTVKGGTNAIIEYFGAGCSTISLTGRATICNMGAEVGATCSVFPFDGASHAYLVATGRKELADRAMEVVAELNADKGSENHYDRVIEIDLSAIEPQINGPFTPDAATPLSEFAQKVATENYPAKVEVALIGSCTNSSYEDLSRAASIARMATAQGLKAKAELIINPGSDQVLRTAERDGLIADLQEIGAQIMTNACGPCIGQWKRAGSEAQKPNSIITSFNRNFAKRNDGNPNTYAFVASPELVTAFCIGGDFAQDPRTLFDHEPKGDALPQAGFVASKAGFCPPDGVGEVAIDPVSSRLQRLEPFAPNDAADFADLRLLIKAQGKCTTDHISMAGSWLRFRGHLENISENLLMGAVNAFNGQTDAVKDPLDGQWRKVSELAKKYKQAGIGSVVVAGENYGEGSSREHAAMEPRFLNVKAVVAQSFARIHETNLKKQGLLALTFADKADYDKILEGDRFSINHLADFTPQSRLTMTLHHLDGSIQEVALVHSYNALQIEWFKAGSALNYR